MKLIAFDASTEVVSVARHDSEYPASDSAVFRHAPRQHARLLLPFARQLLDQSGWTWADVDLLAVGRGPGAFTGLRIAAGLVQGLAYGLCVPVVGVDTLRAIAARAFVKSDATIAQIVQDARMGEIYTGRYTRDDDRIAIRLTPPSVIAPGDLSIDRQVECVQAGNGWPVVAQTQDNVPSPVVDGPHALDIARIGARDAAAGESVAAFDAVPEYVRDDVARKPG